MLRGHPRGREAGIGTGCVVGCRATAGRGPGRVGGSAGHRGGRPGWGVASDAACVGRRYPVDGVAGLADRSHRPHGCPHRVATTIEVRVAEMRREHPRWGAKRIRMELLRRPVEGQTVPATATINRILARQGLVTPRPRRGWRADRVRPGGAAIGKPRGGRETVLARRAPCRRGGVVLSRLRGHPPPGRRCPGQVGPLTPVGQRPGQAGRPGRRAGRACAAARAGGRSVKHQVSQGNAAVLCQLMCDRFPPPDLRHSARSERPVFTCPRQ
jgi:hypothetical protein